MNTRYFSGIIAIFLMGCLMGLPGSAGAAWEMVSPSPTTDNLYDISGHAADDIYAVGSIGAIVHYDGAQWTSMNSGVSVILYGVWANPNTAGDVWAVGEFGTVLRYDGTSWSPVSAPVTSEILWDVWGDGSGNVFIVGEIGTILKYDGTTWTSFVSPENPAYGFDTLRGVWGASATDVYVVGDSDSTAAALHFDGSVWTYMSVTGSILYDVWGFGSDEVYAVDEAGAVFRYDGVQWTLAYEGPQWLWGISGFTTNAVGQLHAVGDMGTIFHYDDGAGWNEMTSGTSEFLKSSWGSSENDLYAVGYAGTILKFTPPHVTSITRAQASPTNLSSVDFTVAFSEPVTGVDGSDFTADLVELTGPTTISVLNVDPETYTVTVSGYTGEGTLGLKLVDDDSILSSDGSRLGGLGTGNGDFVTGETYDVDTLAPIALGITRTGPEVTDLDTVEFNVSFSESVTGVTASDFSVTATGDLTGGSVGTVTGINNNNDYLVTVTGYTGQGTLRLDLFDTDNIVDGLGNPLGGVGTGNGDYSSGEAYTIQQTTVPSVVSIAKTGTSPTTAESVGFEVTFSEPVTGVDASDFSIIATGLTDAGITDISGNAIGDVYTVTVGNYSGRGSLGLNLVDDDSIVNTDMMPLGGEGAGNGDFTVSDDYSISTVPPTVVSISRLGDSPTNATSVSYDVTFDTTVSGVDSSDFGLDVTGLSGAAVLGVTMGGNGMVYTVLVGEYTGSGSLTLKLFDDDGITDGLGIPLGGEGAGNGDFHDGETYEIDRVAPTVVETTPADGATDVVTNTSISATFSEQMDPASVPTTGNILTLSDGSTTLSGTAYLSGDVLDFTPQEPLLPDTTYTATVNTGPTDLAGNPYPGDESWTFTTGSTEDTTPPTVIATSPPDGATEVSVGTSISATFSEPLAESTVNDNTLSVYESVKDMAIPGTVDYADSVVSFTPSSPLSNDTTYVIYAGPEVADQAGNYMETHYSWSFTTEAETIDLCPNDPNKTVPGICGCGVPDIDSDGDGYYDCEESCPNDPNKTAPGVCGCGVPDIDSDGDGVYDCEDGCPEDPDKTEPGICGCGAPDIDSDGDGVYNCEDGCPEDPNKTEPGVCGCGVPDIDSDGDGVYDCKDGCPEDPNKTEPGICGCGIPDIDSDGDGVYNCEDGCPEDPDKTEPGICGCGVPDIDSDGDEVHDCEDGCPEDPNKTSPGLCGCGIPDIDSDGDGTPDCMDTDPTDNQPPAAPVGLSPADGAVLTDVDVVELAASEFSDPDGDAHAASIWSLWPADGGEATAVTETVTVGDLTRYQFPDPSPGMRYLWRVGYRDTGSGQIAWSSVYAFTVTASNRVDPLTGAPLDGSVGFSLPPGRGRADYRMLSFPVWPPDLSALVVIGPAIGGVYDRDLFRIGFYDPEIGGYVELSDEMEIIPGRAYWFIAWNGLELEVNGTPVTLDRDVDLPLDVNPDTGRGWNMIASPTDGDYLWAEVEVVVRNAAGLIEPGYPKRIGDLGPDNGVIALGLHRWEDDGYKSDTERIRNRTGYWVNVLRRNVALRFPADARLAPSNTDPGALTAQIRRTGGWLKRAVSPLSAVAAEGGDQPPMPMAAFGEDARTSDGGGGGCFIRAAGDR